VVEKLLGEYRDECTDEASLNRSLMALLAKLMDKKCSKILEEHDRECILKRYLGLARFARVQELLERIKQHGVVCKHAALPEQIPEPVRRLFLQTPLLHIYRIPLQNLAKQPWNDMIECAERNLQAYEYWLATTPNAARPCKRFRTA